MNLSTWLARHAQNALGSLGDLSRNPVGTLLTVIVIGIALALPAGLNVLVQTGRVVAAQWEDVRDFSAYLAPGLPEERALEIARQVAEREGVDSVRVISADGALAQLREDATFGDVLEALDTNPLPHTLVVRPAGSTDPVALQALSAAIGALPGVDLVRMDTAWVQRLNAILDLVRRLITIAVLLLVTAVVIIVGNTIRLDIQNRAQEIEVAKLLGATDGFVRRPFLYLGVWYGLLGGAAALLILAAGLAGLSEPVSRVSGLYGGGVSLVWPGLSTGLSVLAGGIAAGWCGAWLAVTRHLAVIRPTA